MKMFETDEELQEFIDYFGDLLPNPVHHPLQMMWFARWWKDIVIKNKEATVSTKAAESDNKNEL